MVTDAALWFILAAMIVLVAGGCCATRRPKPQPYDNRWRDTNDRSA